VSAVILAVFERLLPLFVILMRLFKYTSYKKTSVVKFVSQETRLVALDSKEIYLPSEEMNGFEEVLFPTIFVKWFLDIRKVEGLTLFTTPSPQ
jgi:hypothetical protein